MTSEFASGWRDLIERHSSRLALVDEAGKETSYASLVGRADEFGAGLGPERQLVFLEATNTAASIAAYLGCLLHRHPVYLFNGQDEALLQGLLENYRPHIVVRGDARVEWRDAPKCALHPDLCVLLSTSGSTGSAKFVKLSASNVISNAQSIAQYLELSPSERAITSLRFNYSYGMSVINSHFVSGGALVLTDESVSAPRFWETLRASEATSFAGVPYTFETLSRMEHVLGQTPHLRYATQAGGKLSAGLVKHFARLSRAQGWRFYIMYGQTEAAPRISYLPPELAESHPDAIGRAIPGGEIAILDGNGAPIAARGEAGELVYSGPNVMLGYAESRSELASGERPAPLFTGDIAEWVDDGIVRIVGRAARFVKPFGVRIGLDEVEDQARACAPGAVCAGTDEMIVIALHNREMARGAQIVEMLSKRYRLPAFVFRLVAIDEIPRFANGKIAYRDLIERARDQPRTKVGAAKRRDGRLELVLARNQIATLLISGLWHGAAWTFVSWGLFHGVMLVLQRQLSRILGGAVMGSRAVGALAALLQVAGVFGLVAASRVLFRASSFEDAWTMFSNIAFGAYNWSAIGEKATLAFSVAIIAIVVCAEAGVEWGLWRRLVARRRAVRVVVCVLALLVMLVLGDFSGGRFIYVRF